MFEKPREYIEFATVIVISIIFYFYVVHPILAEIAPILTFSSESVQRHGGLGSVSMAITGMAIITIYYPIKYAFMGSIEYITSHSVKLFLANTILLFLILIPNKFIPKKYRPKNMNIDLEEFENHDK